MQTEAAAKAQADLKEDATGAQDSNTAAPGRTGLTDIPPSLRCQLCRSLIERATLTPCCFSSCCYECLKSYLTSSHKLACSRAGVCPIAHCREQDIFVQDLIPNHALMKAADWFVRQRISLMEVVNLEVKKEERPQDFDVVTLGRKLIEDAKLQSEQANIVPSQGDFGDGKDALVVEEANELCKGTKSSEGHTQSTQESNAIIGSKAELGQDGVSIHAG